MSEVEFDEFQTPSSFEVDETPKMIKWVIKYSGGLIKDEKQANYFLLGFVVLSLIFSLFFTSGVFKGPTKPPSGLRGDILKVPFNKF